jgi:murein DD-endopeptidase MepM/ murein hydrolase activator NlpD
MRLKRQFTFLYMPDDHSQVRQIRISPVAFMASAAGLIALIVVAAFYLIGLYRGMSWLPGGSHLIRENTHLSVKIDRLESQIAILRSDLSDIYELQEILSTAVDLDPLDPTIWEAGVGGRGPLTGTQPAGFSPQSVDRLAALESELAKLLRQARIQHQGYQALLDTLAARADEREHLPSIRPVDIGWLSSGYGKRPDPFTGKLAYHHGLDYSIPVGTPVRVTADGVVATVKQERGFGRIIKIDHGNHLSTLYAHLSRPLVKKGQLVKRGDVIAESGKSGRCTAPHLHYEVRLNDRHVNPLNYILDSYATR